ncbi:MAG: SpoIIE family protein phosphatase [Acidobacteriota bacterium]|nr:SpoIIE family protein phosphatase [Acidobacteriota bacterium]
MPASPNANRSRYLALALLFLIAFSFQAALWKQDLSDLLKHRDPVATLFTANWIIVLILHFFTPVACLVLGFYVAFVRIENRRAWLLLAVLITFSINADGSDVHDPIMNWTTPLKHLALVHRTAAMRSWPIWMVVFAIYFPERASFDKRRPLLKRAFLIPLLIVWILAVAVRVAANEGGNFEARTRSLQIFGSHAFVFLYLFCVPVFLMILLIKVRNEKDPDAQRRLRVLFLGLALGIVPAVTVEAIAVNLFHMRDDAVPAWLRVPVFSALALLPVTLAYVTVVQRALDVRVILRQSLQYALARRGVVLLQSTVSLIVIICVAALSGKVTFTARLLITGVGVGAVLFIGLGARRLAIWIDRRFFREAYRTEQVLTSLAASVSSIVEIGPLLQTVVGSISQALHIDEAAAFLHEKDSYRPALALGYSEISEISFRDDAALARALRTQLKPVPVYFGDRYSWINALGDSDIKSLRELNTQLLLPVSRRNELLAFLSLGPKAADTAYSPTDIELLQTVASQTALAIENSQLTATVAAEVAEREIITRELAIAHDVQQRLFPQVRPRIPGVDYSAICRPAREIGGDYYDFIELPGQTLGIAIGDVAGKGIPAALLMASLQASLRGQIVSGQPTLERLITNINSVIYTTSPANRYATFFYSHYQPALHCLTYVNAGHNPPILLRRCNTAIEIIRLEAGGPPVGLLPVCHYESAQIDLCKGDLLVLFTDGISEAMNPAEEEWGEDKLIGAARELSNVSPPEMIDRLFQAADNFAAGASQHDDMTLMVFRFD